MDGENIKNDTKKIVRTENILSVVGAIYPDYCGRVLNLTFRPS